MLVVDDNPLAVQALSQMLTSMSFRVDEAESGEEALVAINRADRSSDPFAVVFLDWRMPGLDGAETGRRIAAMSLAAPPRRVMVTAHSREDVFREADSAGFDGVLVKPVSPSIVFDAALRALGAKHAPEIDSRTASTATGDFGGSGRARAARRGQRAQYRSHSNCAPHAG